MGNFILIHFILLTSNCIIISQCNSMSRQNIRKFPADFMFGTATAAYQIEGAWDADGKSENIWDHFTHNNPSLIVNGANADVAADSYHLYKRDVEMLRELGLDFYRFSISWTRILPTSFPDKINEAGVQYYNNLIDEMLKYNIQPMITLYHWDLPQKLQELGGWTNPEIVNWFSDYARVAFDLFGDRVKYWITINEPHSICYYGYSTPYFAPASNVSGIAEYICAKNLLVAHARAYHIYNKEFRPKQKGSIFISISTEWYDSETEDHRQAAHDAKQFNWGKYSHPIFSKTGDFPPVMKERIALKSAAQGFPRSRLPEFTPEEIELIRGSSDFYGINHYSTYYVYRNETVLNAAYEEPSFSDDLQVNVYQLPHWIIGESTFTKCVPWGFYKALMQIKNDYGNPPIFVTENGFGTNGGLNDDDRVKYYREYLSAMLDAMDDGCDVKGYTTWSLLDNFEWALGYINRFGLYEVDYNSQLRTRTPRKSAFVYKEIVRSHELNYLYEPDMTKPIGIDDYFY